MRYCPRQIDTVLKRHLGREINALRELQSATWEELDALLPSVLDRAFIGRVVKRTPSARFAGTSPKYDIESLNVNKALACRIWRRLDVGASLRKGWF